MEIRQKIILHRLASFSTQSLWALFVLETDYGSFQLCRDGNLIRLSSCCMVELLTIAHKDRETHTLSHQLQCCQCQRHVAAGVREGGFSSKWNSRLAYFIFWLDVARPKLSYVEKYQQAAEIDLLVEAISESPPYLRFRRNLSETDPTFGRFSRHHFLFLWLKVTTPRRLAN